MGGRGPERRDVLDSDQRGARTSTRNASRGQLGKRRGCRGLSGAGVDERTSQHRRVVAATKVGDHRGDLPAHAPDEIVGVPAPPRALGDLGRIGALGQRDREGCATRPALSRGQLASGASPDRRVGVIEQLSEQRREPGMRLAACGALGPQRRGGVARRGDQLRPLASVERDRPRDDPEEAEQHTVVAHWRTGPWPHPDCWVCRCVDALASVLQAERVEPCDDLRRCRAGQDRGLADAILQLGMGTEGQQAPAPVLERDRAADRVGEVIHQLLQLDGHRR